MGFKSKSQNNQQFKVGGLTFPSKNRYNFFRDLDDDINDIVQMPFDEVQEFFSHISPIDVIETYPDAREQVDDLFENSTDLLCFECSERCQLEYKTALFFFSKV